MVACGKPSATVEGDANQLHTALRGYEADYGTWPPGDTVAIMQALKGANARHVVYIAFTPSITAPDGTMLDPWGTSYRIDYPSPDSIRITSAGPDRQFGTSDDIQNVRPATSPTPSR